MTDILLILDATEEEHTVNTLSVIDMVFIKDIYSYAYIARTRCSTEEINNVLTCVSVHAQSD